jgi:hypothetical protein
LPAGWPTPRTCSGKRSSGANRTELLRLWPTAKAGGNRPGAGRRHEADRARYWATPSARDWRSGLAGPETMARNSRPLNEQAVSGRSRPAPETIMGGGTGCGDTPTLNPLFVEALMGWPTGWTGFASVATAWSPWLRLMRGELSRLG